MKFRVTRVTHDKEVCYVHATDKKEALELVTENESHFDWDLVLDDATVKSPVYEVDDE